MLYKKGSMGYRFNLEAKSVLYYLGFSFKEFLSDFYFGWGSSLWLTDSLGFQMSWSLEWLNANGLSLGNEPEYAGFLSGY